jgi:hypothetical protein
MVDTDTDFQEIVASLVRHGEPLAQPVEHIPFKDGVDGSNPSRLTIFLTKELFAQIGRRIKSRQSYASTLRPHRLEA